MTSSLKFQVLPVMICSATLFCITTVIAEKQTMYALRICMLVLRGSQLCYLAWYSRQWLM
jgi:hypothetical protein